MLIIVPSNSYYATAELIWGQLKLLPEGRLFHHAHENEDEGVDHFFSNKKITKREIRANYEED